MASQAACLSGLYVLPVVLSLQDMMASIRSHFQAVGDHLCFCLRSCLTFLLHPRSYAVSHFYKRLVWWRWVSVCHNHRSCTFFRYLPHFDTASCPSAGKHVSLNLSPRRTRSHFQSNDGLWDVFLLNTTAHHAASLTHWQCCGDPLVCKDLF